jgi:hypothetical protein
VINTNEYPSSLIPLFASKEAITKTLAVKIRIGGYHEK